MNHWSADVSALPAALAGDRPVALLMRHAERPPIAAGETGVDLCLTARGRETAEALGRMLGARLRRLHASPVRRCQETAEALRAGAGVSLPIVADRLLGDPGVFVLDPELAWENWRALGHESVVTHLGWRHPPLPGLADADAAARKLAGHLVAELGGGEPGLHVFVTHDAIMLPALARLVPAAELSWWPDYLECAAFWRTTASCELAYRGRIHPLRGLSR